MQARWQINYLLVAVAFMLLGCKMSQSQRYELATTAYGTTVALVTAASISGRLTEVQMLEFDVIRDEASKMLVEWGEALDRGEDFGSAVQLQAVLNRLLAIQLRLGASNDGNLGSLSPPYGGPEHLKWPYYVDQQGHLRAA